MFSANPEMCFLLLLSLVLLLFTSHVDTAVKVVPKSYPSNSFRSSQKGKYDAMYYYDDDGILDVFDFSRTINGSVPGVSTPVVLDFKMYHETCTNNVYFTFLVSIDLTKHNEEEAFCKKGITFCYEGKLAGKYLRPEYRVKNSDDGEQYYNNLYERCSDANPYAAMDLRGLNIAVRKFNRNDLELIHPKNDSDDRSKLPLPISGYWHMFVITATYMKEAYYFISPPDGNFVLQLGGRKNLTVKVIDTEGADIPPVVFRINNTEYGTESFGLMPDTQAQQRFDAHRGLWMLYMDFKSHHKEWQAFNTVHPSKKEGRCEVMVKIRGNRMRPCRTYWQDIMVTEPVDSNMEFIYTRDVGVVNEQLYGEEDFTATRDWFQKEWLKKEKKTTTDIEEKENSRVKEKKHVKEKTRTDKEELSEKFGIEGELRFHMNPGKGVTNTAKNAGKKLSKDVGGIYDPEPDLSLGLKGSGSKETTTTNETMSRNTTTTTDRNTQKLFSKHTKARIMMSHFKSTTGFAEIESSSMYVQSTSAFEKRESVDVKSHIPPGKKIILQQLMFECDGNLVKMPYVIAIDDKKNLLDLPQYTVDGGVSNAMKPDWLNQTSGMDSQGIKLKGTQSHLTVSMDPKTQLVYNVIETGKKFLLEQQELRKKKSRGGGKKSAQNSQDHEDTSSYVDYF